MPTKTLTFHIIFHTRLYKDNLDGFTEKELAEWFSWAAVSEKTPKQIPDWIPPNQLIYEYKLKNYNPMYQMLFFYQNSFFFHLLDNPELLNSRYIGFGQYDMKFNAAEFRTCVEKLEHNSNKMIGFFPYDTKEMLCNHKDEYKDYDTYFIKPYEEYYNVTHTLENLSKWPLFLIHTYILPTWFFKNMMEFIKWNIPNIMRKLKWSPLHIAGTLERMLSLYISAGIEEGRFCSVMICKGTVHNEKQRAPDILRNLSSGTLHVME
jgi:hypothetical protein